MKNQGVQVQNFVVDGVASVSTNNSLHRVVLFKQASQGVGVINSVELIIPLGVAKAIADSLSNLE